MPGARLHFDCFSGLAGDMFLGACLDLGLPMEVLDDVVERLGLRGVTLERREAARGGIRGVRFRVLVDGAPLEGPDPGEAATPAAGEGAAPHHGAHPAGERHDEHRSLDDIRRLIEASALPAPVRERSLALFSRLAEAEARIHSIPVDQVHFHELGALDAIVDLTGAAAAWEHLAPAETTCGSINVGAGRVSSAHGSLPVPAPATAELLRGLPVYGEGEGELVTPTGAVLLAELVDRFGDLPRVVLQDVGYGLGRREVPGRPNAFRLLRGTAPETEGEIIALECTVDDLSGEGLGYLLERLLAGGAVDAFFTPVQMKKNRPGTLVSVLCRRAELEPTAALLLRESGALGCRWHPVGRFEAERSIFTVTTEHGEVRIKEGRYAGQRVALAPEYEDCRRLALERGVPWTEVYRAAAALAAARRERRS